MTKFRVLSVSPVAEDHAALRRILDQRWWHVDVAGCCREASVRLQEGGTIVVFCEQSLPDGSWKTVLDQTAGCPIPPRMVVISRLADDRLWAEVLNLGGFDVLAKPLNDGEVRQVLLSAIAYRIHPHPRDSRARTAEIA